MRSFRRSTKRAFATPLAALILALSVAVPLLERADLAHAPVVESEHQPEHCPRPHDHSVCTQVGANHAAPGADSTDQPVLAAQRVAPASDADALRDGRTELTRSARAPPSI